MRISKGTGSTRRKTFPVPLCASQIPNNLTWDRTWAAAFECRRLTFWAMAKPYLLVLGYGPLQKLFPASLCYTTKWDTSQSVSLSELRSLSWQLHGAIRIPNQTALVVKKRHKLIFPVN
jgi:hypothetical protein